MHVTTLIPTYREKENLKVLIPTLYSKIYPRRPKDTFSTLIVDDNSPDGTRELLSRFSRTYPHLFVSYGEKKGIGAAMKRGYRYALNNLQPDVIVTYEADFVYPPKTILTMMNHLDDVDVVLASRENVSDFYSFNHLRLAGHFIANTLLPIWIGGMTGVREHTAAGRVMRVQTTLKYIKMDSLPDGYAFFPALLYMLAQQHARFYELPVHFSNRKAGVSKVRLSSALYELRDALGAALQYRFSK